MTDIERTPSEPDWEIENPDDPKAFDVDLRAKVIDHIVFDAGHTLQWQLDKNIVVPEQFEEAREQTMPYIEELDRQAGEAGLLGLRAGVRGRNIMLPYVESDLASGAITVRSLNDSEREQELAKTSPSTDEICGPFAGYGLRFRHNVEQPDTYIPQLVYQVSLKQQGYQHAYLMPMATGDVGISELFFDIDERIDARKEILERLFEASGEQGDIADAINRVLASTARYDDSVVRPLGYNVDRLVNHMYGTQQQRVEGALSDLIENYIDLSRVNSVIAAALIVMPLNMEPSPLEYVTGISKIESAPVAVGFFDWPVKSESNTSGVRRTCGLIFDQTEQLVVMPLFKIERFIY